MVCEYIAFVATCRGVLGAAGKFGADVENAPLMINTPTVFSCQRLAAHLPDR
jgi:hypothetical protein